MSMLPLQADTPSIAVVQSTTARRLIALTVAAVSGIVLGVAAWLTPAARGMGTHEQLGLPVCGWIGIADLPCPTCGMTTAFAHAANGDLMQSFLAQPLGCALAIATAMAFVVSLHVFVTGSALGLVFARLWTRRSGWLIAGAVVLAWGYKILRHKGAI